MSLSFNNSELQGKKIIIVEDDVPSIRYYENLLLNSGAAITIFTNGKDFLNHIESSSEKIDLLIIDFLIPFVNGIECTRLFRRVKKQTPVIMVTAYFSEQTKNEALIAGCSEYVLKPVYPEKIYCLLEKYLRQQYRYSHPN